MKLLKYLLPFLALPFFSSLSCGKHPPKRPTYYLTQEFKNYVIFPEGSWWIYENEIHELDTVKLYRSSHEIRDEPDMAHYNFEQIIQNSSTSYYHDSLVGFAEVQDIKDEYLSKYSEGFTKSHIYILPQFFSYHDTGYVLQLQNNLRYTAYYDSLLINNKIYYEVKLFENLQGLHPRQPKKIYYSKNTGVIKKEMFEGTVWELKEYNINN